MDLSFEIGFGIGLVDQMAISVGRFLAFWITRVA